MVNEKVEGAGNYNPIGLTRDSYTLIEKEQMRLKETGKYGVSWC